MDAAYKFYCWALAVLNSNFSAAFFGAVIGAVAAYLIANRKEARENLLQELRLTGASIALASAVCNRALQLKEQHVADMVARFLENRARVVDHLGRASMGALLGELHLGFIDQLQLETLRTPIARLEETVLEKLPVRGRVRQRVITLAGAVASLNDVIERRNEWMRNFQHGAYPEGERPHRLFGVRLPNGSVDMMHHDLIIQAGTLTDDCIYHSARLCEELADHGRLLRRSVRRSQRRLLPPIGAPDYSEAMRNGLFPPAEQWAQWESGFFTPVPVTRRRFFGRLRYEIRKKWREWHYSMGWRPRGVGKWRRW